MKTTIENKLIHSEVEEIEILNFSTSYYAEMNENPIQSLDVIQSINKKFDQLYREEKMIKFLVNEISSYIKK